MKPLQNHWRLIAAVGAILVLVAVVASRNLPFLARWLDVGGPPQRADAVVLLSGGYTTRPFVAAALVHGGWAPRILLNTTATPPAGNFPASIPPSFEIIAKALDYGGVSRDRVVCLDSRATTTFDEAKAVGEYLAAHPVKRLVIVSDGPHTRRARWIFRRVLAGRGVEIAMVSSPAEGFENDTWWRTEPGFLFVVSEYFKLFYYTMRYSWTGYEIFAGLVAAVLLRAWFRRRRKLES